MRKLLLVAIGLVAVQPYFAKGQSTALESQLAKLIRVTPIQSTVEDVKKLLGEPERKSPDFYRMDGFNVSIDYSSGLSCDSPCRETGRSSGWNVPRDTVITFMVFIKAPLHKSNLEKLGVDLTKFESNTAGHIPESIYYANTEEGIGLMINGDAVTSINLFPPKKYFHLMCQSTIEKPLCKACPNQTDGQR